MTAKKQRAKASPRTRVFKFGCLPPETSDERDVIMEQFLLGARYRRKLVDVYNEVREERRMLRPSDKRLKLLYEQRQGIVNKLTDLRAEIMDARMRERTRITSPSLLERHKKLKEQYATIRKSISDRWKALPKQVVKQLNERNNAIEKSAEEAVKSKARNNEDVRGDLHWGTYQLVEAAAKDSHRKTHLWDKRSMPKHLRAEPFRGDGVVSVQIQSGKSKAPLFTSDLFDGKSKVVGLEAREPDRRGRIFTTLRMRATESGKQVSWPILLHRQLPLGVVKRVAVFCRKVGPREVWEALFWIDVAPKAKTCGAGVVAVHFGWKRMSDGRVRAATWLDTHGNAGEVYVDPDLLARAERTSEKKDANRRTSGDFTFEEKLRKENDLKSIRMKNLNEIVKTLQVFADEREVPKWFDTEIASIARGLAAHDGDDTEPGAVKLRDHVITRLCRVIRWWKGEPFLRPAKTIERRGKKILLPEMMVGGRFAGDDKIFLAAEDWRYNDHHLWEWQTSLHRACYARRKDHYRSVAAGLAKRYDTVIIDDTMFSVGVKVDRVEDGKVSPHARDAASELRKHVAPYEFRDIVRNAFVSREGRAETVSCKGISQTCPHCEKTSRLVLASRHLFICDKCGYERELDSVALMNLLRRGGHDAEIDAMVKRDIEMRKKLGKPPVAAE